MEEYFFETYLPAVVKNIIDGHAAGGDELGDAVHNYVVNLLQLEAGEQIFDKIRFGRKDELIGECTYQVQLQIAYAVANLLAESH